MKRKTFIHTSCIAIAGLPFATILGCNNKEGNGIDHIHCQTGEDILGPFYRAEAPFRDALNVLSEEGTPIIIKGTVYGGPDCSTEISQAIIDIWQANDSGDYDNESSDYKFRGRLATRENGRYEFISILPGRYLNGNQYRPRHIHFMVKANNHLDLVTQLYFDGDEYIEPDPWASEAEENRIVELAEADGILTGTFDIKLQLE